MQQGSDLWQYFAVIIIVAGAGYYLIKNLYCLKRPAIAKDAVIVNNKILNKNGKKTYVN
ncbi:MAG: hypothetical protein IPP29_17935 [Bacteroidetes bacterium]|nr:hypothetical protein [Bacteroidota bacterium]